MYRGLLPEQSNKADFRFIGQLIDEDTGEAADLSDATLIASVTDDKCRAVATPEISLIEDDTFLMLIPRDTMLNICAGTYNVGLTVEMDDETEQLIIGTLPVLNGIVPQ